MGQITVYSGPERRRRWSDEQRLQILTEAFAPGASPTEVARRHEISTGLLYTWRKKLSVAAVAPVTTSAGCPGFAEAVIVDDHCAAVPASGAALVIELARGRRITIFPSASPALAAAALKALR
jgi:transposase